VVEYYGSIEQTKATLHKHYNNMKIIIAAIAPLSFGSFGRTDRSSPAKHEK
jgi:hypothetical protein